MTFQITEVLDSTSEKVLAKVRHQDNQVMATVRVMRENPILVGNPFQAEISFDEILDWRSVNDFEDSQSGIWQGQDGIHLRGRIHSILDYGDGTVFIDVYLQNGPEFFTIHLNAVEEDVPDANEGLEITVGQLILRPAS